MLSKTFALALIMSCFHQYMSVEQKVIYLHVGIPHVQEALKERIQMIYPEQPIHIFCRRNQELQLNNIFQSNQLRLEIMPSMKYKQYKASNVKGVLQDHQKRRECLEDKLLAGKKQRLHYISLPSHDHHCYGIQTDQPYNITLLQVKCDKENVARLVIGLLTWLFSMQELLGNCLLCGYCMVFVLGCQFINLMVVLVALYIHGNSLSHSWQPLGGNLISVLKQHPTVIALLWVAELWLLLQACKYLKQVWQHQMVRETHYHIVRVFSYTMLLTCSNHSYFGWGIVTVLLPWPEISVVFDLFCLQFKKKFRSTFPPKIRVLLGSSEFKKSTEYETLNAVRNLHGILRYQPPSREQIAGRPSVQRQQLTQRLNDSNSAEDLNIQTRHQVVVPITSQQAQANNAEVQVEVELEDNSLLDTNVLYPNSNSPGSARCLRHIPRKI